MNIHLALLLYFVIKIIIKIFDESEMQTSTTKVAAPSITLEIQMSSNNIDDYQMVKKGADPLQIIKTKLPSQIIFEQLFWLPWLIVFHSDCFCFAFHTLSYMIIIRRWVDIWVTPRQTNL